MDDSDTRRGKPAAHRALRPPARLRRRWLGDDRAFGESAAIVLGDLLLCWSGQVFADAHLNESAREVWDRMREQVMAGQYLDLLEQARGRTSVDAALRVAAYKTSRYTVEGPLQLGAAAAGAPAAGARRTARLRARPRRGVPAARRRPRRLRRPGPYRQAERRRPARGQAHGARRRSPRSAPMRSRRRCWPPGSATATWTRRGPSSCARSSSTPGRWRASRSASPPAPPRPARRSPSPRSMPDARDALTELVAVATDRRS